MSRHIWYVLSVLAILAVSTFAWAQKEANRRSAKQPNSRTRVSATTSTDGTDARSKRGRGLKGMALTPSRKAAALEFARQHHPELAGLLKGLEKKNPRALHRAMRQLYQTSERLARTKERLSPERFELELEAWKLDSRIRLLAARVSVSRKKNSRLERELQQALMDRIDIRIRSMQREKTRLSQRVGKLSEIIDGIEADPEKAAAQYLKRIKRGLGIKNRKPRAKNRSAKRKAKKKNPTAGKKNDE